MGFCLILEYKMVIYIIERLYEDCEVFETVGFVTNEDKADEIVRDDPALQYREIEELDAE